ncbi:DUF6587 family protein [Xylophilus sp. GW821-FHT01B05]
MGQEIVVAVVVAIAALYATWYWMPARWRQRLALRLATNVQRLGVRQAGAERVAQAVGAAPGCSSCESCGSCATPKDGPPGAADLPGAEPVRIVRRR